MRTGIVASSELRVDGSRLHGGYFLSEDEEAMRCLRRWRGSSDLLSNLVTGRGLFSGGIFRIIPAQDGQHGAPYVSAKDLVQAQVRPAGFISRVHGSLLDDLELREGMILVTCSGMNLGKAIRVRHDMSGLCGSGDLIRIIPDANKVPIGYLYTFLASRYGRACLRKLIFGGHIKHIEPKSVGRIAIPRLSPDIEQRIHELAESAASVHCLANSCRAEAVERATRLLGWEGLPSSNGVSTTTASLLSRRMDAFHHSTPVQAARIALQSHGAAAPIGGRVDSVFEPNRGPRLKVDAPDYGIPFLSSSEVFRLDPVGDYLISRTRTPHLENLLVCGVDVLLPRSGQIGGIIGRAILPLPTYFGHAASEHLVRVRCRSQDDAYYLWAILASEPGYWAIVGTAFGSSIPSLDCELLSNLQVPWVKGSERNAIAKLAEQSVTNQVTAIRAERDALALIERVIGEAA